MDDDSAYVFQLKGTQDRHDGADLWAPLLLVILARASNVRTIRCSNDVTAERPVTIVSHEPPPCGRTLLFSEVESDMAAQVLASVSHPETELAIFPPGWGWRRLSVLADAMMANRCPARLAVDWTPEVSFASPLAEGIRTTTALTEIALNMQDGTPDWTRSSVVLLEAVRDNVGLRTVKAAEASVFKVRLMKDFWSAVLASRAIERVDVMEHTYDQCTSQERRDVARHVVVLL